MFPFGDTFLERFYFLINDTITVAKLLLHQWDFLFLAYYKRLSLNILNTRAVPEVIPVIA